MELFFQYVARILCGFLALVTILPLFPVGYWWVRVCDFPRLHLGIIAMLLVAIAFVLARMSAGHSPDESRSFTSYEMYLMAVIGIAIVLWQFSHVVQYGPWWPREVQDVEGASAAELTLVVANLEYENEQKENALIKMKELDPDLLLLIEFDKEWSEKLSTLESSYPYREGAVREEGLGIMLWSRLPLKNSETRYLVSDERPSIHCQIELRDGRFVNFVGVHPTPPGLYDSDDGERHDSRIRDAELMLVAKQIKERSDEEWIVSGDFNDVAWSHTTRLFKRISGLKDPRVGRGLYNTYHAQKIFMRFPIDHIFVSSGARLASMELFHPSGSDHFGIITGLNFELPQGTDPEPVSNDPEDAEELIDEGQEDAQERDEALSKAESSSPS